MILLSEFLKNFFFNLIKKGNNDIEEYYKKLIIEVITANGDDEIVTVNTITINI